MIWDSAAIEQAGGETFTFATPKPVALHIHNPQGVPVVTVYYDGRVEYAEGTDLDAAAQTFWDALGAHAPLRERAEHEAPDAAPDPGR